MSVRKIAILGGGVGAMAAAFELTNRPDWECHYDITVYQMGWRLGGKGASGRNPQLPHEITEHGLHLWFGFYANAFWMIRQVYGELQANPESPIQSWEDAFEPLTRSTLAEPQGDAWQFRDVALPGRGGSPGETDPFVAGHEGWPISWSFLFRLLELLPHDPAHRILEFLEDGAPEHARETALSHFEELAALLLPQFRDNTRDGAAFLDLLLAAARGIVADRIIHRGFAVINHLDYREWLENHGALHLDSVLIRNMYDGCFAYEGGDTKRPRMEAGTALKGHIEMYFRYRGSLLYRMRAGMGEAVFAPFYLVLRARGVKFEFFQRVQNLALSEDRARVEKIEIEVEAQVKKPPYNPLFAVHHLPCWLSEPDHSQLAAVERGSASRELIRGRDFDEVVLGIPIAVFPAICGELIAARPKWKSMIDNVKTVRTQSAQIWLNKSATDMGWHRTRLLCGFAQPFSTYADFSHLIGREQWSKQQDVRHIAYLCGPLLHKEETIGQALDRVRENTDTFLDRDSAVVWPNARRGSSFDRSLIVHRYDRANVEPSEQYVLSIPGSSQHRLDPGDSGFGNLVLAGDWTRTELNGGCVEAAVMSGRAAARAIRSRQQPRFGLVEVLTNLAPLAGDSIYKNWRRKADCALPPEDRHVARNAAITLGYLDLYEHARHLFKWAGLAAYASERVGRLLRAVDGIPGVDLAPEQWELGMKHIREMNSAVYADIAWAHLAFLSGGAKAVEAALPGGNRQRSAGLLRGFGMIGESPSALAQVWTGNQILLEHEQKNTLQQHYSEMDPLSVVALTALISIDFGPGRFASFRQFMMGKPESPDIADFAQRWDWITHGILPLWELTDADASSAAAESHRRKWRLDLKRQIDHG